MASSGREEKFFCNRGVCNDLKTKDMDKKRDREARHARVAEVRGAGCNCGQAVLLACDDLTGLTEEQSMRLGACLGAGLGCGSTCGVVTAMAMTEGYVSPSSPKDKQGCYRDIRRLITRFAEDNGSTLCAELKGRGCDCEGLIRYGVDLIHEEL